MSLWSPQETELAESLIGEGANDVKCRQMIGKSRQACLERLKRIRSEVLKGLPSTTVHYVDSGYTKAPPEVLEDRNSRLIARMQMDFTAVFCNDPPPGFSALERRK